MTKIIYDDTHEKDEQFLIEHINTLKARVTELEEAYHSKKGTAYWYKCLYEKYEKLYDTYRVLYQEEKRKNDS